MESENVKVEKETLDLVRKHVAATKQSIGGFYTLAVQEKLNPPKYVLVWDNSDGFRRFLTEIFIEFRGEGHQTAILAPIDLFELGKKFQQYKDSFKG